MMDTIPEPIKDYYIAYMDVLGYKQFLVENPDKAPEFLAYIHDAIQKTKEHRAHMGHTTFVRFCFYGGEDDCETADAGLFVQPLQAVRAFFI